MAVDAPVSLRSVFSSLSLSIAGSSSSASPAILEGLVSVCWFSSSASSVASISVEASSSSSVVV